jgi:inorganic triphosphatase YgiF
MWKNLNVRDLQKQFVLKNKRRIFNVTYQKCRAELSLDRFSILVCGREVKMREIELEFKRGRQKDFEALAARFTAQSGLTFTKNSKVKTAYLLRKLWSNHA